MHKAACSIFCMLVAGLSSAYGAPPVNPGKKSPDSFCKAPETALFDCEIPAANTFASICRKDRQVVFRLGSGWRLLNLEVSSNGRDGRAHRYESRMGGNPGGIGASAKQYTMRFTWRGLDFYSYVTHLPREDSDSGLSIEKDDIPLVSMSCKATRYREFDIPNFVDEETDQKYMKIQ